MKLSDPDVRYTVKKVITEHNLKLLKNYIKLYKKDYKEMPTYREMESYIECSNPSLRRLLVILKERGKIK